MESPGVYILKSSKTGRYYIGSTSDVERRFHQHNTGLVVSTKSFRPWLLLKFIPCNSPTEAKQSEFKLKKYKRRDIVEKVIEDGILPWNHKKRD